MIASGDSLRSRWLAPGSAIAIAIAALCRVLGCATIVEEPTSNVDASNNSGLVSSSGSGAGGATLTNSSTATIGSSTSTSTLSTGAAVTTNSVTTSGTSVTTAESSGASSTETSAATSATAANSTSGSASAVTTSGGSSTTSSSGTLGTGGVGGVTTNSSTISSAESNSTTGASSEFCDDARTPTQHTAAEGNTGSFGTTDGVCYRLDFVPAAFAGWGCSNFAAGPGNRTIVVNGASVICGELPLPEPVAGGYYFDFGPGTNVAAAMYWWNWQ